MIAVFGIVRHCEPAGEGSFTAGVQITNVVGETEPALLGSIQAPVPEHDPILAGPA